MRIRFFERDIQMLLKRSRGIMEYLKPDLCPLLVFYASLILIEEGNILSYAEKIHDLIASRSLADRARGFALHSSEVARIGVGETSL